MRPNTQLMRSRPPARPPAAAGPAGDRPPPPSGLPPSTGALEQGEAPSGGRGAAAPSGVKREGWGGEGV